MKNAFYLLLILPFAYMAQITIPDLIDVTANSETIIAIQTPSTITNSNTFDFSGINLMVELTGASQGIIGNYFIKELLVNGDGVKNLNGNITVTDKLIKAELKRLSDAIGMEAKAEKK